jgi:hypothetical protein
VIQHQLRARLHQVWAAAGQGSWDRDRRLGGQGQVAQRGRERQLHERQDRRLGGQGQVAQRGRERQLQKQHQEELELEEEQERVETLLFMIHIRTAPVLLRATQTASAPAPAPPPPAATAAPALPDRRASNIQIRLCACRRWRRHGATVAWWRTTARMARAAKFKI